MSDATFLYPKQRLRLKAFLHRKQDGRCCYCGRPTFLHPPAWSLGTPPPDDFATLEHMRRKAEGGTSHPDNLAIACWRCNNERGDMSWVEFKTLKSRFIDVVFAVRPVNFYAGILPKTQAIST